MLRMLYEQGKIIVARTDRIGDLVLSLPVFATLKRRYPSAELIALVSGYAADVASSFHAVDRVLTTDAGASVRSLRNKLKQQNADAILMLFPRFEISTAAFLAGIPVRVGTAYRWYSFLHNRKVREHRKDSRKSEAEYNLSLTRAIGCDEFIFDSRLDLDSTALASVKEFIRNNDLNRFVVVHPGSGGSAYEWGEKNFRDLARSVVRDLGMKVLVTGTAAESELCERTRGGIEQCINTAGRFTLLEFISLLSEAEVFISNSTGPLHLAASVGTPVIGIYPNSPPMTPVRWAPLTDRKYILTPSDGSDNLSLVEVSDVVQSISALISVKA